ncbi:PSD1 and planctomycete cytochrome C domain-containing protein [Roseimaritima sediminicola]|uniref:PSD1 and planctomycete cytochrome C domain-containing protein n=1 Tax=Roseimaritima sediminicola TaxID=2662066 RepID=UPI001F317AEE|nr:PSD1 and planctomycete cytochrome C domain-containing protein [Roseimaritima sediminicola]
MTDPRPLLYVVLTALWMVSPALAEPPAAADSEPPAASPEQLEFFEKQVRPLLVEHCYSCHSAGADRIEGSLLLDSREAHLRGGDSGEAIVPGDPDGSLLMEALRYESYEMPPKGQLADESIAVFERWIEMGAPWPEEPAAAEAAPLETFDLAQRRDEFWVWQPITNPQPPKVQDTTWPQTDADRFVLARLEEAGLTPASDADRTALLRRVTFDLIGLPPTPEEVNAFLADERDDALERVVDRLLDSPHFGERWARHWLDLVRYAESRGHEFDNDTPNAFQYRDYVIRALNADVPYDQWVREHIAGDLLTEPRLHPEQGFNESVLGTGFWFLGEWVHSPVDIRKDEADRFDNMIDVMTKTFLGVTVACARCHDHKFDAISTADYYSLSGFLQSSDYRQVRFDSIEQNRKVAQRLAEIDTRFQAQVLDELRARDIVPPREAEPLDDPRIVVDYGKITPEQYLQDGFIFGLAPQRPGKPYLVASDARSVAGEDESGEDQSAAEETSGPVHIATVAAAVSDPAWSGLKSQTLGQVRNQSKLTKLPKSGRTLRTPTFELVDGRVDCRVAGKGHVIACVDSHRLVAGPLHGQTIVPIKADQRWVSMNLARYVGHRLHLEFVPAEDAQLSVQLVTQGMDADSRADLDRRLDARQEWYAQYARAAERFLNGGDDVHPLVGQWRDQRQQAAGQIVRESRLAPAMLDGTGEDDHILIRGNASKPGEVEPRHFLTAISGNQPMEIPRGSGRYQLAQEINDPKNPLTARVIVNRLWHHLMGRGIVPTTDDFGFLGQRPTHPLLLDHLAWRFREDGQSLKRMIKYIILSRTYQMSSQVDPVARQQDPKNLLWHHRPPQRLEGEVIRDSLLALSGRLDPKLFGPPVPIHLTSFMTGRGRPGTSGPLDGDGRRSIYISVRRNFLSPFMLTFDTPVPFSSMGRRNVSNVPAQALILLNDPLVAELAQGWAERALQTVPGDGPEATSDRVRWMYQSGFGRQPSDRELEIATAFLQQQAEASGGAGERVQSWATLAHVLVNTKEFIFLR